MRRGTTPTITITTDVDLTDAINLFVTFRQGAYTDIGNIKITKPNKAPTLG